MKIRVLYVAALVAITLVSCSKNDGANLVVPDGRPAKLSISIKDPMMIRATGEPSSTDNVIKTFTVWVFDAAGKLLAQETSANDANSIQDIDVTTSAKEAYVMANCDNANVTGINSKAALLNFIGTLDDTADQSARRWATGSDLALSFTPTGTDGSYEGSSNIALSFIAARITVKIINNMTGYDATNTDGHLVLKKVTVLNGGHNTRLFGTTLVPDPMKWISGIQNDSFGFWPASNITAGSSLLVNDIAADDFTTTYHYYVFENKATTADEFPAIVTLIGEFDGKLTYFPVHLTPYEMFSTGSVDNGVERGHSYNITITLSTDPGIGGGGEPDPTTPVEKAKFDVEISINDWTPVTLGKEF